MLPENKDTGNRPKKDVALGYMKTHFMDGENDNVVGVALFDSVARTETIYEKEQKQA